MGTVWNMQQQYKLEISHKFICEFSNYDYVMECILAICGASFGWPQRTLVENDAQNITYANIYQYIPYHRLINTLHFL